MIVFKDRVLESSSSVGTGVFTLTGAATAFRTFSSAFAVGDQFDYYIEGVDFSGNPTGAFENGVGTLLAGGLTFSRDVVQASSNGGALVNFGAGTKYVGATLNAAQVVTVEYVQAAPAYSPTSATIPVSGMYRPAANQIGFSAASALVALITATGLAVTGTASATAFSGPLTGNVTGNLTGLVNRVTLTQPATGATLTLADGSTFATVGSYSTTLTATAATSLTLPVSGILATQAYVDSLVAGTLNDRGNYDASTNVYPSTGGSGTAGAIRKGDIWYISVAGTLGGVAVGIGDSVRALTGAPGQTSTNWSVMETNIGYVPANVANNLSDLTSIPTARSNLGLGSLAVLSAAPAGTLTGATLASNVLASSLTSVGTLTNLTVTNPIAGSITGNAATVTTNANMTGPITSVGNATSVASQTGTGTTFVMSTSPTLITPVLGVASATSIAAVSLSATGQMTSTLLTQVLVPVQSALSTSTTGGTGLAASTAYFYVVSATNASGETTKSNEQTITTGLGATNSNTVSWAAVTGATGYRVYRGTATGAQNVYYVVGAVTTLVDTGAASTGGAPSVSNTTGAAPFVVTSTTLVPNLYVARAVLADSATTNANLTGPITSIGNATSVANQTGTGSVFVMQASPTLTTPNIGAATGASLVLSGALTQGGDYALLGSYNSSTVYPTAGNALATAWNFSGGLRDMSLWNTDTLASISFVFRQLTGAGTRTDLLTIYPSGATTFTSTLSATRYTSTIATGTAPLVVSSTTVVGNLNVSQLLGGTWAIPGALGATTRNTVAATTLNVSGASVLGATGADSATTLIVRGTANAVRLGTSPAAAFVEGTDNTGNVSFQPLILNGSTTSLYVSNINIATASSTGLAVTGTLSATGAATFSSAVSASGIVSTAASDQANSRFTIRNTTANKTWALIAGQDGASNNGFQLKEMIGGISAFSVTDAGAATFSSTVSGAFNGSLGATTPSTGAFTSLTNSGAYTQSGFTANTFTGYTTFNLPIGVGSGLANVAVSVGISNWAGSANMYGFSDQTATYTPAAAGTEIMSYRAYAILALGAANTITNWYGFNATLVSKTGAAVLTNAYAFYANSPTLATNNYAFYSAGTAPSVLGGALTVTGAATFSSTVSGAFNGTLGATTPNTVAATTIVASGSISSTVAGVVFSTDVSSGVSSNFRLLQNGVTAWLIQNTATSGLFEFIKDGATIHTINGFGIGVGTAAPVASLDINANLTTSSWTTNGIGLRLRGNTYTDNSTAISGTAVTNHIHAIAAPTLAATALTVTTTTAATLYIAGAPIAGANMTITTPYSLLVNAGNVLFGGNVQVGASDTILARDAANTLALKNANLAQDFRVYAGNGGFMSNVKTVTESLTIAAAATTVGASSIPAGAILLGVSVRVTTAIPTAATFTVTTTVGATALNTAAVSTAATSTDPGTAAGASYRAAATTVTITPNLTPVAATGVVRIQYFYLQVTPATS